MSSTQFGVLSFVLTLVFGLVGTLMNAMSAEYYLVARVCFTLMALGLLSIYLAWLWDAGDRPLSSTSWQAIWGVFTIAVVVLSYGYSLRWVDEIELSNRNYCYFQLYTPIKKNKKGYYQLSITGVGSVRDMNYWIAPASSKSTTNPDDPYHSLDKPKTKPVICFPGTNAFPRGLPWGEYRIEFQAPDIGNWNEWLTIYIEDGEVKQTIKVVHKDGTVLYDPERLD